MIAYINDRDIKDDERPRHKGLLLSMCVKTDINK